jgi:exosortase A
MDRRTENKGDGPGPGPSSGFNAPLWIVLGTFALAALFYRPTSLEIAGLWEDTIKRRYTHGWLVLAVTLWLIWRDRWYLGSLKLTPPLGGWVLVALGSLGWLVGYYAGVQAVTTLSLPLLVLATIWAAGGFALAKRVAFPVLLLYFALPVWELVNPVLQWLTAVANLWLAELFGIPVVMTELVIHIPEGSFEIAGGCSGLHFFIVALYIATVQGELDRDDMPSRLKLLLLAGSLAVVTNWLRVFIIILAGHLTNMQHFLVKVDHYYFGWVLFAFTLVFYFWVSKRIERRDETVPAAPVRAPVSGTPVRLGVALAIAGLALGPLWSMVRAMERAPAEGQLAPPAVAGWTGPGQYDGWWRPVFANADEEFQVAYQDGSGTEVALYRAAYHSQRQGKELIGHSNSVMGERQQGQSLGSRRVSAGTANVEVSETMATGWDSHGILVWSVYALDGHPDRMGLMSRLEYGLKSLLKSPTASVVAIAAGCEMDCESARATLESFAAEALPALLPGIERDRTVAAN